MYFLVSDILDVVNQGVPVLLNCSTISRRQKMLDEEREKNLRQ